MPNDRTPGCIDGCGSILESSTDESDSACLGGLDIGTYFVLLPYLASVSPAEVEGEEGPYPKR